MKFTYNKKKMTYHNYCWCIIIVIIIYYYSNIKYITRLNLLFDLFSTEVAFIISI